MEQLCVVGAERRDGGVQRLGDRGVVLGDLERLDLDVLPVGELRGHSQQRGERHDVGGQHKRRPRRAGKQRLPVLCDDDVGACGDLACLEHVARCEDARVRGERRATAPHAHGEHLGEEGGGRARG